jgi:hypothetical protein
MKRVLLPLLMLALIGAGSPDKFAAPDGIVPSNATLAQVLAKYKAATGSRAAGTPDTRIEEWSFTKAGLSGTESLQQSGDDYHAHIVAGPFVDDYGQFLGHGWHRDFNGVVSPLHSADYHSFAMMLLENAFGDAADPKNDASVAGESASPQAVVVAVKMPDRDHPEWIYYDKQTGLIDRIVYFDGDDRMTVDYGDYRTTRGLAQPWHIHSGNGTAALDDDFVCKSATLGTSIAAATFAPPASTHAFFTSAASAVLPVQVPMMDFPVPVGNGMIAQLSAPTVVARIIVDGRGLDFAVSAGMPRSIIDFDVARELGLPTFGQTTTADGENVEYETTIANATWGDAQLRNFSVRAMPFNYHLNDSTKIVGVIGNDVLSSGVFKIDFVHGKMSVAPSSTFDTPPADVARSAWALSIGMDDNIPYFSAAFDHHETDEVLFDNDSIFSMVFGSLVSQYPSSFKELENGKEHHTAVIPFADAHGYGREVDVWLADVPDMQLGPLHLEHYPLLAASSNLMSDSAGLMGGDLIKYYDVYLDYAHHVIWMRPNDWFFKAFKVAKPQ